MLVASFDPQSFGMIKPTVVRNRGMVSIIPTVNTDVEIVGAFGLGIVSDQAFGTGAGAIPGPLTDGDWDGCSLLPLLLFMRA